MFSAFSTKVPFLNELIADKGHVNPLNMQLRAKGTSMMISFCVGFLSDLILMM